VYYFVNAADGSRYGPADIDTLVQWAREGRLVGETTLVERGSERSLRADSITAIAAVLNRLPSLDSPVRPPVTIDRSQTELPTMTQAPGPPPPPSLQPLRAQREDYYSPKSKIVAGLLGIFLGSLGLHRFYLGYNGIGLLMLLLSILGGKITLGASCGFVHLWGMIEGIIILCGGFTDADGRPLRG
jgi:TM2 domain-containing membrane protein YozV